MEWFDLTKTLALAGTCISLVSLFFTWQNRKLMLAQDRRRLPRLLPTLVNGYYRDFGNIGRLYAFLIIAKHHQNIRRLLNGTESRFGSRSTKSEKTEGATA